MAGICRQNTCTPTASLEFQPDGLASFTRSGHLAGDDLYDPTGRDQAFARTVGRGGPVRFYVPIENDGDSPDDIRVDGTGSSGRFTVRYLRDGTDVTRAVRLGTYVVRDLAPGDQATLRVIVTAQPSAPRGAVHRVRVRATSMADSTRQDAVRLTVRRA